jgi:hypothetical protein
MALRLALPSAIASNGLAPSSEAASASSIDAVPSGCHGVFFGASAAQASSLQNPRPALVFPFVIKAGMGIDDEYDEGALLTRGRTLEWVGFSQVRKRDRLSSCLCPRKPLRVQTLQWLEGICVDTNRITSPQLAFNFDGKGLIYNLTLEGSRISRIAR